MATRRKDQDSVPRKDINFSVNSYKSNLYPTSFVFDGYLRHMNVQKLEHEAEYAVNSVQYTILWYITSRPLYTLLIWGTTAKFLLSL
jgi:hypothetical protein